MADLPRELTPADGSRGFATQHREDLRIRVAAAWDQLAAYAETCELDLMSRSKGRRGLEVLLPVGRWDDSRGLAEIVADARAGRVHTIDQDVYEAALRAAHGSAPAHEIVASLRRAGDEANDWLGSAEDDADGLTLTASPLGALPIRTLMHATVYHLAVIALDLEPCAPEPVPAELLSRGLVALVDVAGCLAARAGLTASLVADTARSPNRRSDPPRPRSGASGARTATGPRRRSETSTGPTVAASARVILDITSGRISHVPALVRSGALRLHDVPGLLHLGPLIDQVPGHPRVDPPAGRDGHSRRCQRCGGTAPTILRRLAAATCARSPGARDGCRTSPGTRRSTTSS